jgi:hypothetical protein
MLVVRMQDKQERPVRPNPLDGERKGACAAQISDCSRGVATALLVRHSELKIPAAGTQARLLPVCCWLIDRRSGGTEHHDHLQGVSWASHPALGLTGW